MVIIITCKPTLKLNTYIFKKTKSRYFTMNFNQRPTICIKSRIPLGILKAKKTYGQEYNTNEIEKNANQTERKKKTNKKEEKNK